MSSKTFEQAMERLEKIIQELESGELPLEKAMNKFEEGIELTRFCSRKLDETEEKINILLKDKAGAVRERPFDSGADQKEPSE